ncbi:hypothetical protein [Streptosporangium sp. NPDC051022]|uniref:hypothetical protein n=1 Tax=Streptosporangium sp. NPDC051022 TaxID=3155752 RepID=UPI00343FC270
MTRTPDRRARRGAPDPNGSPEPRPGAGMWDKRDRMDLDEAVGHLWLDRDLDRDLGRDLDKDLGGAADKDLGRDLGRDLNGGLGRGLDGDLVGDRARTGARTATNTVGDGEARH